jgi:endoglucanase
MRIFSKCVFNNTLASCSFENKNVLKRIYIFAAIITALTIRAQGQYLHTMGQKIVDKNNNEIILRGMGLGGWMVQEGYMLETNSFANTQHDIRKKISELVGETNTAKFYDAWLLNHCTERDIDSMAAWGFNAIRLPMHYNLYTLPIQDEPVSNQNTWLEKGFIMTDSLLKWCSKNKMYLILDLHAAPGGQGNDAAISDYDKSKPSLWEADANKQKTIALWSKLAERYAAEPWIGGYDLINETNWNFTPGASVNGCDETTNVPLRKLFTDITDAIRKVDTHHIIFIEGNCWANNHSGLMPAWDSNMAISFHKYWNYNDVGSIQGFINMRNQYNIPIWLGESGENSNTWFTNAIQLLESNSIGWAWWPEKKINSIVNPLTVVKNDDYNALLDYWKNGGTKPSVDFATNALLQQAANLKIEKNIVRKDVIDAMFRQVVDHSSKPFAPNKVPGVIQASDYDMGRNGVAYADTDTANYQVSTGTYEPWNSGYSYRNDGVDIQPSGDSDTRSNGYNIGWTADGEWLQYTLNVDSTAAYSLALRYAVPANTSAVSYWINGGNITNTVSLPSSGDYQVWTNQVVENVVLYKGRQKLKLKFEKGGANVGFLNLTLSRKIQDVSFKATAAQTSGEVTFSIMLNKKADTSTLTDATGFTCTINGDPVPIRSLKIDPKNQANVVVEISHTITNSDVVRINYSGNTVKATDATSLEGFSNLVVQNNVPFYFVLPTTIEAEQFQINSGLQSEACTDNGGGQDMGHTNAGDYLEYNIRVTTSGDFKVALRIACNSQAGKIELQQLSSCGTLLNSTTVDVPVTGGWQTWQTVYGKLTLTSGDGILRLRIAQPEFNVNWISFSKNIIDGVEDKRQGSLKIYPNPTSGRLTLEMPEQFSTGDNTISIRSIVGSFLCNVDHRIIKDVKDIDVGDLPEGTYIIELERNGELWSNKFIVK